MKRTAPLLVVLALGCEQPVRHHESRATTTPAVAGVVVVSSAPAVPAASLAVPVASAAPTAADAPYSKYAWPDAAGAARTLRRSFAAPDGFARVPVALGSFGAFLRDLPLMPAGTAVKDHRGNVLRAGDDENIAAVVAIDVGAADLQQCADSIVRLHAEWRWAEGARDHSYKAAASLEMPLARFVKGERVVMRGRDIAWQPQASARPVDHALFREYLDTVFAWANTGSLARDATKPSLESLTPGDFFVLPGGPGHAVLVLDVATHADGRKHVLLGQGFMPAQSFQVLRPSRERTWYAIDPQRDGVKTPFWPTFPWGSLRRMEAR